MATTPTQPLNQPINWNTVYVNTSIGIILTVVMLSYAEIHSSSEKINNHEVRITVLEAERTNRHSFLITPKSVAILPDGLKEPKKETEE
jgi:hypothetical protein